jgi:hypothetical protein
LPTRKNSKNKGTEEEQVEKDQDSLEEIKKDNLEEIKKDNLEAAKRQEQKM